MNGQRFDTFSRWLATRKSRRTTLRGLATGALALALDHLSLDEVAAGCQRPGQKCSDKRDCCAGAECKREKCVCKRGVVACGGACCSRGQQCTAGGKEPPVCCAPEQICGPLCCPADRLCVGAAANPLDPAPDPIQLYKCICHDGYEEDAAGNCGCPHVCGDDCCEEEDGEVCCSPGDGHKYCVQISSSDHNCGECGHKCPKGRTCQNGKCVCAYPTVECNGQCVHLNDDHDNCGRCGNQCFSNHVCQGGECIYLCEGTVVPDGGCCSDIDCWIWGDQYYCCNGSGCDYFDGCAYGCVDDTNAEGGGLDGFIICTVL